MGGANTWEEAQLQSLDKPMDLVFTQTWSVSLTIKFKLTSL
jgi:hypothetical protein